MLNAEVITQALSCGHANCRCNKQSGKNYITHCPAHKDNDPSLSISEKDGKILVKCFGGCTQQEVIAALKERNLWPGSKPGANMGNNKAKATGKIVATYDYVDAESNLLFQVVRYQPKTFRQRRPDGKGGWIWNLEGVSVVPYCLPEILSSTRVYICEGEEDVKALRSLGLTATTNPGGASKWREEFSQYFQSKEIVILPDNDEPGRKHARDILQKLHGAITWGKVVELPKLPPKGDPRDWVNAGGRVEELEALVQNTPEWIPTLSATAGPYQISDGVMSYLSSRVPFKMVGHYPLRKCSLLNSPG
jgi:putative DNA primase/helicase